MRTLVPRHLFRLRTTGVSGTVGMFSVFAFACAACPGSSTRGPDSAPQAKTPEPFEVGDSIYEGALKGEWQESGSAVRELSANAPARVQFRNSGEWTLTRRGLAGRYGGLLFRVKEPPGEGEFLQVHLASSDGRPYPNVKLKPDHRMERDDGWTQVLVPMSELDPDGAPFDRIVIATFRPFGDEWISFDQIALAKTSIALPASLATPVPSLSPQASSPPFAPGKPLRIQVRCDAQATKISPLIYGIAGSIEDAARLGVTARRWGGNPTSRYNWQGSFWNTAQDWFFENGAAPPYTKFLDESAGRGALSALTIPTIGWVAKDATSSAFPVSVYGPQGKTDPWHPDIGNGVSPGGANLVGVPGRTSVAAPPDWIKHWIASIVASDAKAGSHSVYEYILDNEPMLWSVMHRDLHPEPLSYDELLDRTIRYAGAIREADPNALIAGPAEWGWSGYFYSAKDLAPGLKHGDRLAHGDSPLIEWYLKSLRAHEQKTGTRLLDVLDLHYYPQGDNVYGGGAGGADKKTQLLRLRSTRSLWDPSYVDESWINESVRLLPRMKEWVARNYPGRGISIGEWNFGGEKDITGALATAEALGRFAQFGVTSAFYWTAPPPASPSSLAFLAYRNFDGKGGRFLDWYVPVTVSSEGASFFVSRDPGGKHFVVVAINMAPDAQVDAEIDLGSCGVAASHQAYTYVGDAPHLSGALAVQDNAPSLRQALAPWSITVVDIHLRETGESK